MDAGFLTRLEWILRFYKTAGTTIVTSRAASSGIGLAGKAVSGITGVTGSSIRSFFTKRIAESEKQLEQFRAMTAAQMGLGPYDDAVNEITKNFVASGKAFKANPKIPTANGGWYRVGGDTLPVSNGMGVDTPSSATVLAPEAKQKLEGLKNTIMPKNETAQNAGKVVSIFDKIYNYFLGKLPDSIKNFFSDHTILGWMCLFVIAGVIIYLVYLIGKWLYRKYKNRKRMKENYELKRINKFLKENTNLSTRERVEILKYCDNKIIY